MEIPLQGGQSTDEVIRVGDTVRRSLCTNSNFVHAFLQHLEEVQFSFAPRFIGIDDRGREILSYCDGEVPRGMTFSDEHLISSTMILRELHDKAATSGLRGSCETICHNDFAQWNLVFKHSSPVGIIDFDECAPGDRIDDLAYFIWTMIDLGATMLSDKEQIRQVKLIYNAYSYNFSEEFSEDFSEALLKQMERILIFRKDRAANDLDQESRTFSAQAVVKIQASMEWVNSNSKWLQQIQTKEK